MITCDITLKELESLRKLCGEQEVYFHRKFTQHSHADNKELSLIMKTKSSNCKKLRYKLTDIIDNELERIINDVNPTNKE